MLVGNHPIQKGLCNKIEKYGALDSIILVDIFHPTKRNFKDKVKILWNRVIQRLLAYPLVSSWKHATAFYSAKYPSWPSLNLYNVDGANDPKVHECFKLLKPDLVLVSGTNLLSAETIKSVGDGRIMNLHTGLSPYVRGGPNCTHISLSLGRPDLIGNTVMWIDAGIDSGNIITSEKTSLSGNESVGELIVKNLEHGQDLYCRVVNEYLRDSKLQSVCQSDLGKGRLFLAKNWGALRSLLAIINFAFYRMGIIKASRKDSEIKTVNIVNKCYESR